MDFAALFIIAIGFILIVVGWQGTYAKIWSGLSTYTAAGATANQTPTNQPGTTAITPTGNTGTGSQSTSGNPGPGFPAGSQSGV